MSKKTNSSPASEEKAKEASAAEQNEQTAALGALGNEIGRASCRERV